MAVYAIWWPWDRSCISVSRSQPLCTCTDLAFKFYWSHTHGYALISNKYSNKFTTTTLYTQIHTNVKGWIRLCKWKGSVAQLIFTFYYHMKHHSIDDKRILKTHDRLFLRTTFWYVDLLIIIFIWHLSQKCNLFYFVYLSPSQIESNVIGHIHMVSRC